MEEEAGVEIPTYTEEGEVRGEEKRQQKIWSTKGLAVDSQYKVYVLPVLGLPVSSNVTGVLVDHTSVY
jgi:hypothetical protein